jgi:hypothetical protein
MTPYRGATKRRFFAVYRIGHANRLGAGVNGAETTFALSPRLTSQAQRS